MKFLFHFNGAEQTENVAVSAEESLTELELANVTGGYGCGYDDDYDYGDDCDDEYDDDYEYRRHRHHRRRRRHHGCDY